MNRRMQADGFLERRRANDTGSAGGAWRFCRPAHPNCRCAVAFEEAAENLTPGADGGILDAGGGSMLETGVNNIREQIDSGELSDVLSPQKHNRHVEGTKEFNDYVERQEQAGKSRPSKLYLSADEAQEVLKLHAGTGDINIAIPNVEFIGLDRVVGVYEEKGQYIETRRLQVIYGKRGSHLFPVKELR